jgi:hypothetical protein
VFRKSIWEKDKSKPVYRVQKRNKYSKQLVGNNNQAKSGKIRLQIKNNMFVFSRLNQLLKQICPICLTTQTLNFIFLSVALTSCLWRGTGGQLASGAASLV